jgi:2-hydroxychromene-2-carboxylate isomerase
VKHLVIYGDFNCPYSALASSRAERLERAGAARVEWRAVEHDPVIPPTGINVDGEVADELDRELDEVRRLLVAGETLELRRPTVRNNTHAAVAAYAATESSRRPVLRAELFDAVWTRGAQLDERFLVELGCEGAEPELVATWRAEWLGTGRPIVPSMVLPDGYVSRGLGALARLADLLGTGR